MMLVLVANLAIAVPTVDPEAPANMAVVGIASGFKLYYKGDAPGDVTITIYNNDHEVVFTETIRDMDSFIRPYNLTLLGKGEYVVELDGGNGRQTRKVSFGSETAELLAKVAPVTGSSGKYVLYVPGNGSDELHVEIYGEANELLYSETNAVSDDFARVYDVTSFRGVVAFRVSDSHGHVRVLNVK